jgi:hypothetical protein
LSYALRYIDASRLLILIKVFPLRTMGADFAKFGPFYGRIFAESLLSELAYQA